MSATNAFDWVELFGACSVNLIQMVERGTTFHCLHSVSSQGRSNIFKFSAAQLHVQQVCQANGSHQYVVDLEEAVDPSPPKNG